MKQRTWPDRTNGSPFASIPFSNGKKVDGSSSAVHRTSAAGVQPKPSASTLRVQFCSRSSSPRSTSESRDFSALPYDVIARIAASFARPDIQAASLVCRSWSGALRPMREAMVLLQSGKRFKHGRAGVRSDLDKALDAFLGSAARGSTLAMVDAGLLYWGRGEKEKAMALYLRAAVLGDSSGQYNLGISYSQAEPPNLKEAIRWLYQASMAGHTRAQYRLALSLRQDCADDCNLPEAARWYMKAAEGGHIGAMYNVSRCYSYGEGLVQNHRQAKKWMKRAADRGHSKAQLEHGLALFSKGDMIKAVVYLELATRAGETAANHVKTIALQKLSRPSCDRIMLVADHWRSLASR